MAKQLQQAEVARRDPRAWRADSIDDSTAWYYPLTDQCLAELNQAVADLRLRPRAVTDAAVSDYSWSSCREAVRPAHAALESGRGFAIIDRLSVENCSAAEAQLMYWLIGQLLGQPFQQNVQGTLLYDVRDTGQDVAQGARFSVTSYESSFHTDNSFGSEVLDYVGLLCLKTAKSGGMSQVLSGHTIYHELLDQHPDVLAILCQPFHVDRRGGIRQGQLPVARVPVIEPNGGELVFRYLRYWIEAGHQKMGEPLTPAQCGALDTLDHLLQRPEFRVEFSLRPGQMFFINNRWILHNRTAFEDYPQPEQRRHYVRLWLRART